MNKPISLILALGVGAALSGCGNTLSGAKQDAATDTQKTQQAAADAAASTKAAADKAGKEVAKVPQAIGAATVVTPEVKTAILRDTILNDPNNRINVDSHEHVIVLSGHVTKASMKQRATEDAQDVVTKRHGDFTVENKLTVGGAQ